MGISFDPKLITGENSDAADNIQDMVQLMQLETDPARLAFLLDSVYKIRGIPVPPAPEQEPAETQLNSRNEEGAQEKVKTKQQQKQPTKPVK